ncbi:AAA family ATPase [Amycolatopsis sacchari]|uniref:AAA family ATPase n=2 Tax=Amycolatopsis sacchari TaxID=115433 RepID=UPI003D73B064
MRMTIERRSLVVVAGLPGSGKSTLLRRTAAHAPVTVLDSDQARDRIAALVRPGTPYRRYRPLVHVLHRLRVTVSAFSRAGPLVVHDPATGAGTRTWLLLVGLLSLRSRHFVWVECSPDDALAGQRARGRVLRPASFQRHVDRLPRVHAALRNGPRGWTHTHVIDRAVAGLRLEAA